MASWQKRARLGVAIFGVVFAGIVYSAIRERPPAVPPEPVRRVDPKAIAETYSPVSIQFGGGEQQYAVTADRVQQYEGGSQRLFGVRVTVPKRGGKDFVITANEAYAASGETNLGLTGSVKVAASDGFELETDAATFDQRSGIARSAGVVSFRKGRMNGSGKGMTYDQPNDILQFASSAHVVVTGETGSTALEFSAGGATLDRPRNVLSLERMVHAIRGEEVIDADAVIARLTESDDIVTYLELRGSARVAGGSAFDSMSAHDIDLDYTDDGETLERVILNGDAAVLMAGNGEAGGRRMSGGRLDLHLARDGSLTSATGQTSVRVDLPAVEGAAPRSIRSETFEARGEPGRGLTSATFTSAGCTAGAPRDACVVYREEPMTDAIGAGAAREARAQRLEVTLSGDAVTGATFRGSVSFDEKGFRASAAAATYTPGKGTLSLSGDGDRRARVEEEQITVDARTIDVGLEERSMAARSAVETLVTGGTAGSKDASRLPRLLKGDEGVSISAGALQYEGSGGTAIYTGAAILSQGPSTTIRGQRLELDRKTGNLTVTGDAIARLALARGNSVGRAHEIAYDDARRTITYSPAAVGPTNDREGPVAGTPAKAALVQLNVPDGDVTAGRIEVALDTDGELERLEAYSMVTVTVERRRATGARLTFHAADGRYVMEGAPGVPVQVLDQSSGTCSETTGSTLTFFRDAERMTVDGKEFMRTQTKGGGACGPLPLSH